MREFLKDYETLYQENSERIEGYLIHDVFLERLTQLSTKQDFKFKELDSLIDSTASEGPIPDSVLSINDYKIAVEFKTRGFEDQHLLIKKYYHRKYQEYIEKKGIEAIFVLHAIYPFDFENILDDLLGKRSSSPSTDSALFIPMHLYQKLPEDINPPLKNKRKNYLGVKLNDARSYDLLYNGWNNLINNLIDYINGDFSVNSSDSKIRCMGCDKYYYFSKECHPYIRSIGYASLGYCYFCIQKELGNLAVFLFEDVIPDMIDDGTDILIENESDYYYDDYY